MLKDIKSGDIIDFMTANAEDEFKKRLEYFSELQDQGDLEEALEGVKELVKITKDNAHLVNALILQASLLRLLGETDKALRTLKRAFSKSKGIHQETAEILAAQSHLLFQIGEHQKAEELAIECLDITRKFGQTPEEEVNAAVCMGYLFQNRRDYQKALCWYMEGLKICNEYQLLKRKALLLVDIGKVYGLVGQLTESIAFLEQARSLSLEIHHENALIFALYRLADPYRALGDRMKAAKYCEEALGRIRGNSYRREKANSLYKLGLIEIDGHTSQGADRALDLLFQSLEIHKDIGYVRQHIYCLIAIGDALKQKNDVSGAFDNYYMAFKMLKDKASEHFAGFIRVIESISALKKELGNSKELGELPRLSEQLRDVTEKNGVYDEYGRNDKIVLLTGQIADVIEVIRILQNGNIYSQDELIINFSTKPALAIKNGKTIKLTPGWTKILHCLFKKDGKVCTEDELLAAINWPGQETRTISSQIYKIRKAIGPEYIITVPCEGFKLLKKES